MTTAMTNLSLSYCAPDDFVPYSPWIQLNKPPPPPPNIDNTTTTTTTITSKLYPPLLYGHDAITTVYNDTEWMIVTGGQLSISFDFRHQEFYVWLLNLTHADLFDEEIWFQMTYNNNSTSDTVDMMHSIIDENNNATQNECDSMLARNLLSNENSQNAGTAPNNKENKSEQQKDPWERQDIWDAALSCAPGPHHDHLTVVVNDYLYVFGGYETLHYYQNGQMLTLSQFDLHTHRIHLDDVFKNDWSGWKRILPRSLLNLANDDDDLDSIERNLQLPLRGGLWRNSDETDDQSSLLPKLIVLTGIESIDGVVQIWSYDFTKDEWSLFYQPSMNIQLDTSYVAVALIRDFLLIKSQSTFCEGRSWLDLSSKRIRCGGEQVGIETGQKIVFYTDTENTETSVVIGYGGSDPDFDMTVVDFYPDEIEVVVATPKTLERLDPSKRPPERIGHSVVLSSKGNMYVYGGRNDHGQCQDNDKLVGVWSLNVGTKGGCKLHLITDPTQEQQQQDDEEGNDDDYVFQESEEEQEANVDDYFVVEEKSSLIVVWIVIAVCIHFCFKYQNRQHDTALQQQQEEEQAAMDDHPVHNHGGTIARLDEVIDQQPQQQEPATIAHNNNAQKTDGNERRKEKEEEGLEMMSVYSLELFEEEDGGNDDDGGESVYSIMTAPANVVRRSGHERRHKRRGRRRQTRTKKRGMLGNIGNNDDDDERSAPLAESSAGAMC